MPVYENKIEITITMDAECASTAHFIASRLGEDAGDEIRKKIADANPGLPDPLVHTRCEYRPERWNR